MDERPLKAPNLKSSSLYFYIEETMEVQAQAQEDNVIEVRIQVHNVVAGDVLPKRKEAHLPPYICLLKVNGNNTNLSIKRYPLASWISTSTFAFLITS